MEFVAFPTFPLLSFSSDLISADRCLKWGLMVGLWDLSAMGLVIYLGDGRPQLKSVPCEQGSFFQISFLWFLQRENNKSIR